MAKLTIINKIRFITEDYNAIDEIGWHFGFKRKMLALIAKNPDLMLSIFWWYSVLLISTSFGGSAQALAKKASSRP